MHSVSRLSTSARGRGFILTAILCATGAAFGADLPPGPGKAETEKLCSMCHEVERSISPRQDRAGWQSTVDKMINLGASGTDEEFAAVINYLAKNFPAAETERLNVNKARAIELESTLGLPRSQVAAIVAYREKNGPFKSIADLKKVPGIDTAKIDAKKDRLAF